MKRKRRASGAENASPREATPRPAAFAETYPHVAKFVRGYGYIEVGDDLPPLERRSFIRALGEGGLIWAGDETYPTLDDALAALDAALGKWMREELGE
jgi:hypothetical protein